MNSMISKHHGDSLYYECLAKKLLSGLYADDNFYISDRPDVRNDKLNVYFEVTESFPVGAQQAINLYTKKNANKLTGKLAQDGYEIRGAKDIKILLHPTKSIEHGNPFPTYQYIIDSLLKKIAKVTEYKNNLNENSKLNLFMFADMLPFDNQTLNSLIREIVINNDDNFENVIISFTNKILIIYPDNTYRPIEIPQNDFLDICNKALKDEENLTNE